MARHNQMDELGIYRGYNQLDDSVFEMLYQVSAKLKEHHVSRAQIIASFVRIIRFRGRNL